jgi:integrase
MRGSVSKRCSCPPAYSARGERMACKIRHGSWSYVADDGRDPKTGRRRQVKRGGFATKGEAEQALAELVDGVSKGATTHDERQSVRVFLETWLADKERNGLRPTTVRSYRQHVDQFFVPAFGHLRLRELRPGHVEAMLADLATPKDGQRRRIGPASARRIHATLRSALATAVRRRLLSWNPAVGIELPTVNRPKVRPWEPGDLGAFLDKVAADPFGSVFEVIAATGLRRGEALGLRWDDIDLEASRLTVRQQLVHVTSDEPCPYCARQHKMASFGRPKTASGEDRVVDLDSGVIGVLMAHRLHQDAQRAEWGPAYSDHGLVFPREDGTPWPPERLTKVFGKLVADSGLRRIRLHDLRHGQASLMLAAGVPMAVVSKRLGHSTIGITADTYSHLLEGVGRDAAERAAALIPRQPKTLVTNR